MSQLRLGGGDGDSDYQDWDDGPAEEQGNDGDDDADTSNS